MPLGSLHLIFRPSGPCESMRRFLVFRLGPCHHKGSVAEIHANQRRATGVSGRMHPVRCGAQGMHARVARGDNARGELSGVLCGMYLNDESCGHLLAPGV